MSTKRILAVALALILGGSLLAWTVQTSGGDTEIKDVRWVGANGTEMSGLLYIPEGVTAENPAPGIVAIHGYINSRETQDGFAIEFARRGYVVLAADQTGHGYSDGPAFANGFGGPDSLTFLRSLDIVDPDNIGLEGHSMGGWAVLIAAALQPDGYKSVVIEGSSTGTFGAPDATEDWPRNMAVVFSEYDEFSELMWLTPKASDVASSDKLKAAFGTTETVEIGRVYGSIEDGTARALYQPPVIHPGDHLSRTAIGHAIDWFDMTLDGGNGLDSGSQTWMWKEFGNLLAAIGMVLLLFPVGAMLLKRPMFADLAATPEEPKGAVGPGWWAGAAVFTILPAATLFRFKNWPTDHEWAPTALFSQNITTQVMMWAIFVGLISLVLFVAWHFGLNRKAEAKLDDYGLTWAGRFEFGKVGKSLLLSFLIVLAAYITLVVVAFFFTTDFRFWVFAIKPMSTLGIRIFLSYLIPFTLFFLVVSVILYGQLRKRALRMRDEMLIVVGLLIAGFVGLIAWQYIPLLTGGTLGFPDESLWGIIAFQFLPLMTIVGLVSVYFYRKTARVYVGSFMSAMLVTWIVTASQATHFAF
ncbi:MAG: alpha/beta fold hydrolase [Acidimicrobiia bacterium]|nr:alpha/beta fold hydrolase [Acidimicrobiia bacterium]